MIRHKKMLYVVVLLFLATSATAQSSTLTANDILRKMLRTDAFAWEGAKTRMSMVLIESSGERQVRRMEILARRYKGLMQALVRFLAPQKIAGTAFLMLERKGEVPEQYIYLSGLKRTRRIVGREREGSFMGTDFTYADLQGQDAKNSTSIRLPDEAISGIPVYVIQSTVNSKSNSTYSKIVFWVRKSDFIALRTRFYDRKGRLFKTLYTRRVKKIEGNPVIMEARMQNNQTGHATELIVNSINRKDELPNSAFTPNSLEHW